MAKSKKPTDRRNARKRTSTSRTNKRKPAASKNTTWKNAGTTHEADQGPAFRTLTPYLAVNDAAKAIDWYKSALGAKEVSRTGTPDGKILHCELMLGDSRFMLSDIFPGSDLVDPKTNGASGNLHVYAKNIDDLFQRAVENGCEITMPLENQFWGDRYGKLRDPFGHVWSFGVPGKMTKVERETKEKAAMATFASGVRA